MRVAIVKSKSKNVKKIINFIEKKHSVQNKYNWKNLFTQFNPIKNKFAGVALLEKNIVKGFLATIYSTINVSNKRHELCNTSTWVVDDKIRGNSLLLLNEILKDQKKIFIAHTVIESLVEIHKKFGFEVFEKEIVFSINSPFNLLKNFIPIKEKKILRIDKKNLNLVKNDSYKKIILDHIQFKCEIYSYINIVFIGKIKTKYNLKYFELLDCSNKIFFAKNYRKITEIFCREEGFIFIKFDSRFIYQKKSLTFFLKNPNKKMIKFPKNKKLKKIFITNLYSEIFLLNL